MAWFAPRPLWLLTGDGSSHGPAGSKGTVIPSRSSKLPDPRDIIVVIPAHDERKRLPACLASVRVAAEHVPVPVTVIVVLDDCTDGSQHVIQPPVRVLSIAAGNVGAARAAGFAHAASYAGSGTWFATTDADSIVESTWLAAHLMHHRSGAEAVVGTVRVDWQHHSVATRREYERRYAGPDTNEPHGHVHGANLGIRADAYWRVGGFRPLARGEDVDLVDRLECAGAQVVWDGTIPVLTSDRPDSRAAGGFGYYVRDLAG